MNVLLLFSYGISLKDWHNLGILEREILLYKRLSEKGIHFNFLTYGTKEDLKYMHLLKNLQIYPVENLVKSKFVLVRFLKSVFLPFKLKNIFKNVDIIKTNQVEGAWVGLLAKIFFRKILIVRGGYEWLRNYREIPQRKGLINYLKFLLNYSYIFINELLAYRFANIIMITSQSTIDFIVKTFKLKWKKKKILLFPNFVDVDLFRPKNLEKKDKSILFVGRLVKEKNLLNLLKALKNLNDFTLDIIGTGPQAGFLRKQAGLLAVNVKFLGVFRNDKLPDIYNKYETVILPSFFEGNPKVLLEAMSCGATCIGTNVRGIKEIIKHKENGYLCNPTTDSIRNAIIELHKNKKLRLVLGNNARIFIEKNFSLDNIVKKEFLLYKSVLKI